jgi:hypothetical protein
MFFGQSESVLCRTKIVETSRWAEDGRAVGGPKQELLVAGTHVEIPYPESRSSPVCAATSQEINEYPEGPSSLDKWDLFLNLRLAYLNQDEFTSASAALEKAVLLGPEHRAPHFNLAIVYETENRLSEALREICGRAASGAGRS